MIPYIEDFLSRDESDALFAACQSLPAVRPKNPRNSAVFVRKVSLGCFSVLPESRTGKTAHGGGANYLDHAPDEIKSLQGLLSAYAGKDINYFSVLAYEDEKDHINFHQHREDRKQEDMSVWVISLGQVRQLVLRPKGCKDRDQWEYLYPAHGSLYLLPHSYNDTHEHAILDRDYPCSLRISINCKHIDANYIALQAAKLATKKPEPAKKNLVIATNGKQSIYCCRKHCLYPADAVYVGCKWGDFPDTPFGNYDGLNGDAWKVEVAQRMATPGFPELLEKTLRGKDLLCWCKPGEDCHAKVWLELANA